jgi:glycosyltransferase involved in cell wall biosynthesis/SAM-dependent methyltransferase
MERLSLDKGTRYSSIEAAIHVARYLFVKKMCVGKRVLDVACGEGYGAALMARWGAQSVRAIDNSMEAIESARANFPDPKIIFSQEDVKNADALKDDGAYDLAVSFETIEHVDAPEAFLRDLRRAVTRNGNIVISCPNDAWYYKRGGANPFHKSRYTFDGFRTISEAALGPATFWNIGTFGVGFSSIPWPGGLAQGGMAESQMLMLSGREIDASLFVPMQDESAPREDDISYYLGVWGPLPQSPMVFCGYPVSMDMAEPLLYSKQKRVALEDDRQRLILEVRKTGMRRAASDAEKERLYAVLEEIRRQKLIRIHLWCKRHFRRSYVRQKLTRIHLWCRKHFRRSYVRKKLIRVRLRCKKRYDGIVVWLSRRENELELLPSPDQTSPDQKVLPHETNHDPAAPAGAKPRVALIVDRPDWALANIAYQLEKRLSDEFEIDVIAITEISNKAVLAAYMTRRHDLVHFFWRDTLRYIYEHCFRDVDYYFGSVEQLKSVIANRPTTFSVYDHLFLSKDEIADRVPLFNEYSTAYTVSSKRLEEHYKSISAYPAPAALTPDGVDLDLFKPANLNRFAKTGGRPLRVGWVGNSAWASEILPDPKGFNTVLKPSLEQLHLQGVPIEGVFADRKMQFIPHHRMPDYYNSIDILVCTSSMEGTPNPVLEAMACGVPVISTNVGIVPDVVGPLQKEFVLEERNIEHLKHAIMRLVENSELLMRLSEENLVQIRDWDWSARAEAFRSFFREMLHRRVADPTESQIASGLDRRSPRSLPSNIAGTYDPPTFP